MADPIAAPVVSTDTDKTHPLDAGSTTTEGKGSKLVVITSSILAALGVLTQLGNQAAGFFPADSKIGLWIAVGAGAVASLTQIVYTVQRTALKVAAINAGRVAAILGLLALPCLALADDPAPTPPAQPAATAPAPVAPAVVLPFTVQLPSGWTFHPNITIGPAAGRVWDLTGHTAKWTSNVTLGGLYCADYKSTFGICGGAAGNITDTGKLQGAVDLGFVLMKVALDSKTQFRPAIIGQYTEADAKRVVGAFFALSVDL